MKQKEDAQSGQSAAFDSRVQTPQRVRFRDSELVQNKFAVLGMLFFVTGFLGLPLLWLCRGFSNAERWFWAITNTIYTSVLIWIVYRICLWSWNQISPIFYS